jgi:hypothetical protein
MYQHWTVTSPVGFSTYSSFCLISLDDVPERKCYSLKRYDDCRFECLVILPVYFYCISCPGWIPFPFSGNFHSWISVNLVLFFPQFFRFYSTPFRLVILYTRWYITRFVNDTYYLIFRILFYSFRLVILYTRFVNKTYYLIYILTWYLVYSVLYYSPCKWHILLDIYYSVSYYLIHVLIWIYFDYRSANPRDTENLSLAY